MKKLFVILMIFSQIGCAGFGRRIKNFLSGDSSSPQKQASNSDMVKYSDNPDLAPRVRRQYKRTTKETLANDAGLDQKAGSLWVMEGQGAYLFAQNVMRLVGDPIGVTIDGEPKEQLQAKADILKELIAKIEERAKARARALAAEEDRPREPQAEKKAEEAKEKKVAQNEQKPEKKPEELSVKTVPTRITERTVEGNYRVKGSQPLMIGSREFKVIVTGVVRAEDFSDDGIPASKLLDPKFDIVTVKRQGAEL